MKRNWRKEWEYLIALAEKYHLKVDLVTSYFLHDYVGMNPEAAREMGFHIPENTIWILKSLPLSAKCHTLHHEIAEYHHMKKGMKYYPAHVEALREEKK
jgi:hypothetical protein